MPVEPREGRAPPILTVEDLRVSFSSRRATLNAVNGISFELNRGETLAIVGESGSGKSVSCLALMRLLPEGHTQVSGRVLFEGRDILRMGESELREIRGGRMGMVFQDPMSSLNPVRTVGAQMEETIRLHLKLTRRAAHQRAAEFLGLVGIPSAERQLDSFPHQLSGGMRQRVMIAMAISCEPRVLLADEPTTALDVSVQAQILELLRSVTQELDTSLIMISHDLSVVAGLADRIAVMYAGDVVETGATEAIFDRPRHPYTLGLLRCLPRLDEERVALLPSIEGSPPDPTAPRQGCLFAPRCAFVLERCVTDTPLLEVKAPGQRAACWANLADARVASPAPASTAARAPIHIREFARADAASTEPEILVDTKDVAVHFRLGGTMPFRQPRGLVRAVDGVSFEVLRGETLGIVGESGSGKSTTAKAILQLEHVSSGSIVFEGREIVSLSEKALRPLRPRMQMVFQDPYGSLNPRMTVGKSVAEPLVVHRATSGDSRREARERVAELMQRVGLDQRHVDRYPHELSGGQRQRVSIARALALEPSLIIADEPTSALDVSVRAQILNLMLALQAEKHLTYIFISHDLSIVRHMSNRIAVMYLGKIVELADRDSLYRDPQHPYTRALLSVVPIPDPVLEKSRRRVAIPGEIPSPANPPSGCRFHPRCPLAFDRCRVEDPLLLEVGSGHQAACFLAHGPEGAAKPTAPAGGSAVGATITAADSTRDRSVE